LVTALVTKVLAWHIKFAVLHCRIDSAQIRAGSAIDRAERQEAQMAILILGLVLIIVPHMINVVVPAWRTGMKARWGTPIYAAAYSAVSLAGLVLVVWGFALAWQDPRFVYTPPSWGRHITLTLMIFALILAFAAVFPAGWIKTRVGHPLLTATMLWGAGHLFANGDLAGVVLFGAFLAWAVIDRLLQPPLAGAPEAVRPGKSDLAAIVAGLVLYVVLVGGLHYWLFGVSPLG
jgi:uncharacterized membrane protein